MLSVGVLFASDAVATPGAADVLAELLRDLPADEIQTGILYDRAIHLSQMEMPAADGSPCSRTGSWRRGAIRWVGTD
jgi:hypothetical protein